MDKQKQIKGKPNKEKKKNIIKILSQGLLSFVDVILKLFIIKFILIIITIFNLI